MSILMQKSHNIFIKVHLLDDSIFECDLSKGVDSKEIFEYICKHLSLTDSFYFGLRYNDRAGQRHWLSLDKPIRKQLKTCNIPYVLYFRVRLYPSHHISSLNNLTLHLVVAQIQKDLAHGRVLCPKEQIITFISYILAIRKSTSLENPDISFDTKNFPLILEEDISQLKSKVESLSNLSPRATAIILIEKMYESKVYGLDPHPLEDRDFNKMMALYPNYICYMENFTIKESIPWTNFSKVIRNSNKVTIIWKEGDNRKISLFVFKVKNSAKHFEECIQSYYKYYSDFIPKSANVRRAFTTILRKSNKTSSIISPGPDSSHLTDINENVKISEEENIPPLPSSPSRSPFGLARSLTSTDSNFKPKPLILHNEDESISRSTTASMESRVTSLSDSSENSVSATLNIPQETVSPDVFIHKPQIPSFLLVLSPFQMGLVVLLIAVILFFILLALK